MCDDLIDSVGYRILGIDCDDSDFEISNLSELGDNWKIESKCPKCNRLIAFTKDNVNKLIYCKCGQKIKLEILENLL